MQREISIKSDQNVGAAGNEQPPNQRIKRFSRYPQSSLTCKFDALTVVRLCRERGANKKEKKERRKERGKREKKKEREGEEKINKQHRMACKFVQKRVQCSESNV